MLTASTLARKYVRNRVEAQMTSRVTIYRNTDPSFDAITGIYTAHKGESVYSGKARIYGVDGAGVTQIGEGTYVNRTTFITIPATTRNVPRADDVVVVTHSIDPDLVGRAMRVITVDGGSVLFPARRLQVSSLLENGHWSSE